MKEAIIDRGIPEEKITVVPNAVDTTYFKPKKKSTKLIKSLGIKNKSVILIDDSLVRGTTCLKIVKMLYESGAKDVHVRIACPEIKFPDFYGVDMPTKKELLAANKSVDEIREIVSAKTLKFLSIKGLYNAMGFEDRSENYPQLTDHYFTGDYPVKPVDELGDSTVSYTHLTLPTNREV